MKTQDNHVTSPRFNNLTPYLLSDTAANRHASLRILKSKNSLLGLKIPDSAEKLSTFGLLARSIYRAAIRLVCSMRRALSPLRRIVSRELEVYKFYRSGLPESFALHDTLECGHVHTNLSLDVFDLLNAYTQHPALSARRHHCQPCASLLTERKQPKSVAVAKAAIA